MAESFDKQLGSFLRKQRGELSYAKFARKIGIGAGTLHRLEQGLQSTTLRKLEGIVKRLKCSLSDVFKL